MDDVALLDQWRAGDRKAGNALIERYYADVFRFVFRRTFNEDSAADITHATFEAVVKARDRITFPRAYFFKTARSKLYRHYGIEAEDALPEDARAAAPTQSSFVRLTMEEDLLVRALRSLSIDDQILLELKEHQDLTRKELIVVLGLPQSEFNSLGGRIQRANAKLKRKVEELRSNPDVKASVLERIESWSESVHRKLAGAHPTAHQRLVEHKSDDATE